MKSTATIAVAYILIAIFTFGWSFNALWPEDNRDVGMARADTIMAAFGCSIFWPLYWSTELTRNVQRK